MNKKDQRNLWIGLIVIGLVIFQGTTGFIAGLPRFPASVLPGGGPSASCSSPGPNCQQVQSTWKITFFAINGSLINGVGNKMQVRASPGTTSPSGSPGTVFEEPSLSSGAATTSTAYSSGQPMTLRVCSDVASITTCSNAPTKTETLFEISTSVPYQSGGAGSSCTQPCISSTFTITPVSGAQATPFAVSSIVGPGQTITASLAAETESGGGTTTNYCGAGAGNHASCFIQNGQGPSSYSATIANQNTGNADDSGFPGSFPVYGSNQVPAGSVLGMYAELRTPCGASGTSNGCNATTVGSVVFNTVGFQGSTITLNYGTFDKASIGQLSDTAVTLKTKNPPLSSGVASVGWSFDNTGIATGKAVHFVLLLKFYLSATYFTSSGGNNNIENVNEITFGFGVARVS